MAIAYNTATSNFGSGVTASTTHAATGSDRIVLIGILNGSDIPSAISYGAQTPTRIRSEGRLHLYYLLSPNTGTQTVSATIASDSWCIGVLSYTGVSGIGTFQAATESETTSITTPSITSATGDLVVDVAMMIQTTMTPGGGQTSRIYLPEATHGVGFFAFGMSEKAGAATTTMSWSASSSAGDNHIIAVPMTASGGGGGGPGPNIPLARRFGPQSFQRTLVNL